MPNYYVTITRLAALLGQKWCDGTSNIGHFMIGNANYNTLKELLGIFKQLKYKSRLILDKLKAVFNISSLIFWRKKD